MQESEFERRRSVGVFMVTRSVLRVAAAAAIAPALTDVTVSFVALDLAGITRSQGRRAADKEKRNSDRN